MKMKPKYIPYMALGFGVIGFFLRFWLFTSALDQRGLFRPDHPANALSYVVLAAALGLIYLALRSLTGKPAHNTIFPKRRSSLFGSLVGCIGILAAVLSNISSQHGYAKLLHCILGIAAAAGILWGNWLRYRENEPNVLCHGAVSLYMMLHLITQYRVWSSEPQLQEYLFPLLTSVFLMLTAYHRACLDNFSGSRKWFVFFNYSSVLLCITSLYSQNWPFYLTMGLWCATCDCSLLPEKQMQLPRQVLFCLNKLKKAGYEAYVVGGCVRDSLLGLIPKDYDMCTDATPVDIARVFRKNKLLRNGEKHGTIGVILDDEVYEITTFRTEGCYSDNRHPDWVKFVSSLGQDLARRDFTINAMAYSPETGYIDRFGGVQDLQNGILRTVGMPERRFHEDALRILRGVRFAVRFHLVPEAKTSRAMTDLAPLMDNLANERVFLELCKLLPLITAQQLIEFAPVITRIIPPLAATVGFQQCSPHHSYDVYTHTAYTVQAVPQDFVLRFAALLHDIGKPQTFTKDAVGRGHFYGHAQQGAKMADEVLTTLRAPTALREQVVLLIEQHMTPLDADKKLLRRRLRTLGMKTIQQLLTLQKADFFSKGVEGEANTDFDKISALLEEIAQEDACITVKDLSVNGNDLLKLGVASGPSIGECLQYLLDLVQDEIIPNRREELLSSAKAYFENNKENG